MYISKDASCFWEIKPQQKLSKFSKQLNQNDKIKVTIFR